jgi:putative Ig domain-containing protein
MKPNDQQFCTGHSLNLFGRFSHVWERSQGKRYPIRTGYPCFVLAALVLVASGILVGCGGSSYSAPPAAPSAPPTLPSAASLPSSCTAAATVGAYNCQIAVSSGKAPFTWTANKLPQGLKLTVSADTTTATISGTVQSQQATTTVSFTAPVAEAASTTTASVQLTVTSSTGQSASLSFSITLTISPLGITTTSPLPGATLGSAYTATVTASGGLQPYAWSVVAGSLPAGLNLGAASGTISGTPTATGTFVFTLKVSDAESSPMTLSSGFTLTVSTSSSVNCPAPPVNFTLCGSNVFGIKGFVGTTGPAIMAASFVADNSGHVVSGVVDINSVSGGQANVAITGGSYSVGADGRGGLTLIDSNGVSRTFRFVLESAANAGAAAIEEFDASGTLAAGPMLGPLPPPFATISPNTTFAVQLEGENGTGQRAGMLGELRVGSSGCNGAANSLNSVAGEAVVTNTAGTLNTALTITGSCTAPDPNTGRGTATITISGGAPFTNATLNFVYYTAGTSATGLLGLLLGGADAIATNQPILGGLAQVVTLPIPGGPNACAAPLACILAGVGTTDGTITTGHAVALLVRVVATGTTTSGTFAGVLDENFGGTIKSAVAWPYSSYAIDANGVGTITCTVACPVPAPPIIHVVADGRFMDESVSVITGDTNVQNATMIESPGFPYIIGEAIGSSGVGTTPLVPHVVGVVTPTGTMTTGTLPGTVDVSSSAGSTAGFAATGTYTIVSTTGRGTGTANLTGGTSSIAVVFYGNRHRRFSVLDVQSSDPYVLGARLQ